MLRHQPPVRAAIAEKNIKNESMQRHQPNARPALPVMEISLFR